MHTQAAPTRATQFYPRPHFPLIREAVDAADMVSVATAGITLPPLQFEASA